MAARAPAPRPSIDLPYPYCPCELFTPIRTPTESSEAFRVQPLQNEGRYSPPEGLPPTSANKTLSASEKGDPNRSRSYSAGHSCVGSATSGFEEAGEATSKLRSRNSPARDVATLVQKKGTSPESRCRPYPVEVHGRVVREAVADEEKANVVSRDQNTVRFPDA